jgi:hypothetical protein
MRERSVALALEQKIAEVLSATTPPAPRCAWRDSRGGCPHMSCGRGMSQGGVSLVIAELKVAML